MSMLTATLWKPVLRGVRADAAWQAVQSVSSALADIEDWTEPGGSLARGAAGAAVLFGYLAKITGDAQALTTCRRLQDVAGELMAEQALGSGLYGGFPGIGWAASHLRDLVEPSAEDPATELDDAMLVLLDQPEWHASYDLIGGLVGHGVYGLERLATGAGRAILTRVIQQLDRLAVSSQEGLTWFTPAWQLLPWQREGAPDGYWNLGLAHGVPGILALLGRALKADVASATARRLLEGGMAWLLSHQNPEGRTGRFAPTLAKGQNGSPQGSRVAWCYGDLGLATALLQASRDAERSDWEAEMLQIAREVAARPRATRGILDPGLCHGSAGNALLFMRLYHATGEGCFLDAALEHLDWTLAYRDPAQAYGGFPQYALDDQQQPVTRYTPGLLEGNAGIALALLAALADQAPDWDRHLLVCLQPRSRT